MIAKARAAVGVAENGNAVTLVTVDAAGNALDRRHVDLTPPGTPTHPHHHEGSWAVGRYLSTPGAKRMSLDEAVALVERVRALAVRGAHDALDALARAVPTPIVAISLRACPPMPLTIAACITDARAQTYADTVMYRQVIAADAEARRWKIVWHDRDSVFDDAGRVLGVDDVDVHLRAMGRALGPPWQARHKLAAAAAIASLG